MASRARAMPGALRVLSKSVAGVSHASSHARVPARLAPKTAYHRGVTTRVPARMGQLLSQETPHPAGAPRRNQGREIWGQMAEARRGAAYQMRRAGAASLIIAAKELIGPLLARAGTKVG